MLAVCPSCGLNLIAEEPVRDGRFSLDRAGLCYDDTLVDLKPQERELVASLMHAKGRVMSVNALIDRTGAEAERNPIAVLASHVRRKLRQAGAPNRIENIWGKGYRWRFAA